MTSEKKFVELLHDAVLANFAVAREGKSMNAITRYEDTMECPKAMFYGVMTEYLGEEFARNHAYDNNKSDYDSLMFQYNLLLISKEPSPRRDNKKMWKRYVNKKKLIINYIKLNNK